jgi:hypothetical protein
LIEFGSFSPGLPRVIGVIGGAGSHTDPPFGLVVSLSFGVCAFCSHLGEFAFGVQSSQAAIFQRLLTSIFAAGKPRACRLALSRHTSSSSRHRHAIASRLVLELSFSKARPGRKNMKARFFLLVLLLSQGASRLGAKDVPSDAKAQLKNAWGGDQAGMCLMALRLLVTNSAQPGATAEATDEARSDALGALKAAGFPAGGLLNEAFKNPNFRDWLAAVMIADPAKTPVETEQDSKDLVDWLYDQDGGITKLGDVTRAKAAHPDSKDLVPLLSLLDAVPLPSGGLKPTSPDPSATCPASTSPHPICQQPYVNKLDAFRAAYALKFANWSMFDYIAEKINGSPSK